MTHSRSSTVTELMAEFLRSVEECKALTTTRKVLAPLPDAQREMDPSEIQRLDDYIDRMKEIFMKTPPGQLDLRARQTLVSSVVSNVRRGKKRSARSSNKAKRARADANVIVTEENERVTPSRTNE